MSVNQPFDRQKIAQNLSRQTAPSDDFVTKLILTDLADRVGIIARDFKKALLIAPCKHHLIETLDTGRQTIAFDVVQSMTPDADMPDWTKLDTDYDLVVSLYDLAVANDVPQFLSNMRDRLTPDGLFIAAFVGGTSLTELRHAWLSADAQHLGGAALRVAPMIELRDAGALLQAAKFGLPVIDVETHTIRYADPIKLMREVKNLGGANPLKQKPKSMLSARHLSSAAQSYIDQFSDEEGRVRATLEIIWLSGWKPHNSQQKPLKPGSAKHSLADFLNDKSGQ